MPIKENVLGFISKVMHPKNTFHQLFNNRHDQPYDEVVKDFRASHKINTNFQLTSGTAVAGMKPTARKPTELGEIVNDNGIKLEDSLKKNSIPQEYRTLLRQPIIPEDNRDYKAEWKDAQTDLDNVITHFKPLDPVLARIIEEYEGDADIEAICEELGEIPRQSDRNLDFYQNTGGFPPADYASPFPPAAQNNTAANAIKGLEAYHKDELQHLKDTLTDKTIADWLGYADYKDENQDPDTQKNQEDKINAVRRAVLTAKETQQQEMRDGFAAEITPLQEELTKQQKPYNDSFKKTQDDFKKSLQRFESRIGIINNQIKAGKVPNYQALIALVTQEKVQVRGAITKYHGEERHKAEEHLNEKKNDENYRKAVASFYDLPFDDGDDAKKTALDNTIDQFHSKQLTNLDGTHKKELEAFDKKVNDELAALHAKQLAEEERIAFFGMMMTKKDSGAVLKDKTLENTNLTTRSGLQISYNPKSKELGIDLGKDFYLKKFGSDMLTHKLDEAKASRDLNDLMEAAHLAGIKPIVITVTGSKNPEETEKLARRAYEAAINNGYKHEDIQMKLPHRTEANKDQKGDPKEWIFGNYQDELRRINAGASRIEQYKQSARLPAHAIQEQRKEAEALKQTVDQEEVKSLNAGQNP